MEELHQCLPAELEQVMNRYGTTVYRLAYAQTRSASDAEDIYQEVFLRYFRKCPHFESEGHRKAWLIRVCINVSRSLLTSSWWRNTVPLDERIPLPEQELQDLSDALDQLRRKDRELLHLFYYEELSTREMARILGRKESTVRTQLTRARARLGEIMKGASCYEGSLSRIK